MTGLRAAWSAEWLKARRSRLPAFTFAALTIAAGIEALFMFVAADADRARAMGLLGQKAELVGISADWSGLLVFAGQVLAVGSLPIFSFVTTWVFGREFVDGTAHRLMAQPVSRTQVVAAKLALVGVWCGALACWLVAQSLAVGALMGLPGWSAELAATGVARALAASGLMILAITPIALVASAGRGYLAALAAALGLLVLAQVAGVLGFGAAVPWSVPAVAAGLVAGEELGLGGVLVCLATAVVSVAATVRWWNSGDAGA